MNSTETALDRFINLLTEMGVKYSLDSYDTTTYVEITPPNRADITFDWQFNTVDGEFYKLRGYYNDN